MTPGITVARAAGIDHTVHEYAHDAASASYGLEAAEKLGLPPGRVFKTLVAALDSKELVVAVMPVSQKLNMKNLARAAGARKAAMADRAEVERVTGYVLGGVSPLGQKRRLRTFIDASVQDHATIFVSAGRRGLEIELAPEHLKELAKAGYAPLCS